MIRAESLTRKYGDFCAVNRVNFEIRRGQVVGLLGHNGAGKTTIIKMLTGYLEPTEGRALVDGVDVAEDRLHAQQKIGYLPENCPLYPEMTVIGFLDYAAQLRGIDEARRPGAIRQAIERTALTEKATATINTLSKGYRQRVGVAQALLHNPEIIILDEPTSGLDPSQIGEVRGLVRELSEYSTIILSTHILQEVEAVCDRVIIVLRGNIALDAELADLRRSRRLLLNVDKPLGSTKFLAEIRGVNGVKEYPQHDDGCSYLIGLEHDDPSATSAVAKAVLAKGHQIYALHPERRCLETIFGEISEGKQGGINVE
jgi:ABC-2 type transport system ATP-binding protein